MYRPDSKTESLSSPVNFYLNEQLRARIMH